VCVFSLYPAVNLLFFEHTDICAWIALVWRVLGLNTQAVLSCSLSSDISTTLALAHFALPAGSSFGAPRGRHAGDLVVDCTSSC
jgi:hypothetical protein